MKGRKAFTLIELMVVIMIVGILAAVAIPIMQGRIDSAKWSEATTSAGSIRYTVRAYIAEKGPDFDYSGIETTLDSHPTYEVLGFTANDLDGAYFNQQDYSISNINANNRTCLITVASSVANGPSGTGTLAADGTWSVSVD